MNLKLVLVILLSSMAVLFIAQNTDIVEIGFLYWRLSMSSALLIFFTMTAGFILGWFLHGYLLYRKTKKNELGYLR